MASAQWINSRSAAEHGLNANGASSYEYPTALVMNEGQLEPQDILEHLGTGLYISNLWYLNYSDQPAARLTGTTRFATFWVENGQIVAPVSTMRFDDSVYSRSEEHTSELQSLMRISYAVFCLKKKKQLITHLHQKV